ncbi:hypothetical protein DICSQDRAFT_170788 [Dichomitus squalens LYAD-421 SS1]|uniref:Uncharacterized protein n=1 Tax=Dichomitus squalens (strain LYAD-421) TaxID=732165 RepID=R7T170_DICSQ|nr:uncharacterized protein DICSQDRAFT_170788 [Dichomitus squalens LYAD-421 SS1]EJF60932.1 hypothetical protein DICSQDRAFT_170788 [Dichomitus squalens LYAD-421 SS1]
MCLFCRQSQGLYPPSDFLSVFAHHPHFVPAVYIPPYKHPIQGKVFKEKYDQIITACLSQILLCHFPLLTLFQAHTEMQAHIPAASFSTRLTSLSRPGHPSSTTSGVAAAVLARGPALAIGSPATAQDGKLLAGAITLPLSKFASVHVSLPTPEYKNFVPRIPDLLPHLLKGLKPLGTLHLDFGAS